VTTRWSWKLDRLGRTTKGLIELAELLKERGIGFKSLQDNIDNSTPMGQFFFVVSRHCRTRTQHDTRALWQDWQRPGLGKERRTALALKGQDRADAMLLIENGRPTQYIMEKFKASSTVDRNWKQWKSEKESSADKNPSRSGGSR
jgi:DNA invertase Pin-like site-specific DNA recombinase